MYLSVFTHQQEQPKHTPVSKFIFSIEKCNLNESQSFGVMQYWFPCIGLPYSPVFFLVFLLSDVHIFPVKMCIIDILIKSSCEVTSTCVILFIWTMVFKKSLCWKAIVLWVWPIRYCMVLYDLSLLFWLLHTANVDQRFFQSTCVNRNPFILGYAVLKGPAQSSLIYFVINSSIQTWALV